MKKVNIASRFSNQEKKGGGFANENSLLKLLYAGLLKASEKWTHPVQNWNLTLSQPSIHYCRQNRSIYRYSHSLIFLPESSNFGFSYH